MRLQPKTTDKVATFLFYAIAAFLVLLLCLFIGYILYQGRTRLNFSFLTSSPQFMREGGGIAPQLFNSFYLIVLSMLITVPIGLSAGIYMAEYAKPGRITNAIRLCIETLSSLPSIVIGLFGLLVFVSMTGWGYTLMSGALAVSILNLPTITRLSEDAIRSVPSYMREASLGLGATKWQTIYKVVIPSALPGLITGIVVTSGRAFGEAAALLYTAGMSSPKLDFTNWNIFSPNSPLNPFRPAETLAVHIWKVNTEGLVPDARQIADGAAAVLVIAAFLFNMVARFFGRTVSKKLKGE